MRRQEHSSKSIILSNAVFVHVFQLFLFKGGIIVKFEPLPPAIYYSLAHQLLQVCGRPSNLRKGQAAFDALKVLAGNLISHDMALLSVMQLLASATLVDAYHGNTNRPRCLADTQT